MIHESVYGRVNDFGTAADPDTIAIPGPPSELGDTWVAVSCEVVPNKAITANASNYASFQLFKADGTTAISSALTTASDSMVLATGSKLTLTGTQSDHEVAAGSGLVFKLTKGGTGVATDAIVRVVYRRLRGA